MDDTRIIELYFSRSEQAISETRAKYGGLCGKIALGILHRPEDAEEAVSSSYMKLWNAIPPKRPQSLCGYLCTIVRNTALNAYEALRRHSCEEQYEELAEIIPDGSTVESRFESAQLSEYLNEFLSRTGKKNRVVFMARYYYNMSITDITENTGMSASAVKSSLMRTRKALRTYLEERGVEI